MSAEHWFEKFALLKAGDIVDFDGLRLKVWCILSSGGCQFSKHKGGEVIPRQSELWEIATIVGKSVYWVDSSHNEDDDQKDPADWWQE